MKPEKVAQTEIQAEDEINASSDFVQNLAQKVEETIKTDEKSNRTGTTIAKNYKEKEKQIEAPEFSLIENYAAILSAENYIATLIGKCKKR